MKWLGALFLFVSTPLAQLPSCLSTGTTSPLGTLNAADDFETDLSQWTTGGDVPRDPNHPGQDIAWDITIRRDRAYQGLQSAQFTLDGRQDDGTIWLQRAFTTSLDRSYRVTLSFQFWSEDASFNTIAKVAAYAGPQAPAVEADFNTTLAANLVAGWRSYNYSFTTRSSDEGQLWVAFGISAVWEAQITYYLDNVEITVEPL